MPQPTFVRISIGFLKLYQKTLSPDHGLLRFRYPQGYCRYSPTCSTYAIQALEEHGFIQGWILSVWRIIRCNPFSKGGDDPVPRKKSR